MGAGLGREEVMGGPKEGPAGALLVWCVTEVLLEVGRAAGNCVFCWRSPLLAPQ